MMIGRSRLGVMIVDLRLLRDSELSNNSKALIWMNSRRSHNPVEYSSLRDL
jgi:hypothetical protein